MENSVTQIANNFITLHKTRRNRPKSRWTWVGLGFAVIGLLSFYGATKAHAEYFSGKEAEEIVYRDEVVSENWEGGWHHIRVKYKNCYYGCLSKVDSHLSLECVTVR
jgi:hypothetical protein